MKTIGLIIGAILSASASAQSFHNLEFSIKDINSSNGKLYVQLFKGEQNFNQNKAAASQIIPVQKGQTTLHFPNLTPGEYAIRFFHDENGDGTMATNLFGMPAEGYGFSNNAKPNMGPASFADAKFTVGPQGKSVTNFSKVIY